MHIIVGLGNPGRRYAESRHNIGFNIIDLLADKNGIRVKDERFKGLTGKGKVEGREVMLLKPLTYMNLSGMSVLDAVEYYRIDFDNLIVVYDDADLELGQIRIRRGGSAGTHNGMKSVIYQLQREDFPRLRVGIGRPEEDEDLARYVLCGFGPQERETIDRASARAVAAIEAYIVQGVDAAMGMFNG